MIWVGAFFAPIGYVTAAAALAALAFVPVMVWGLLAVEKARWIFTWLGMVLLPTVLAFLMGPEERNLFWTAVVFLAASYVFFWTLKVAVDSWTRQLVHRLESLRRPDLEMD